MDYRHVPGFLGMLRKQDTTVAKAFEFVILTAARNGEVLPCPVAGDRFGQQAAAGAPHEG